MLICDACISIIDHRKNGEKFKYKLSRICSFQKMKSGGGAGVISSKPKKYEDGKEKGGDEGGGGKDGKDGDDGEGGEEELDEEVLREDRIATAGVEAIMREYGAEIKMAIG